METQAWNCFLKAASDLQRRGETDGEGEKPSRRARRVEKKKEEKQRQLKGKTSEMKGSGRGEDKTARGE